MLIYDGTVMTTSGHLEFSMSASDDGNYIVIEVIGRGDRSDVLEISAPAFELGVKLGIRCFLNDMTRFRSTDNPVETLRLTQDHQEMNPTGWRACVAALIDPDDHSHDFYLAFARSQGIEITAFTDRAKAIDYLTEAAPFFNEKAPH